MKIITSTHKVPYFSSRILDQYFKDLKMGIFDIETLGLSPQFAPLILAGFMTVEKDGSCQITQYFAETPGDERYILEYLREDFDRVDYLFQLFRRAGMYTASISTFLLCASVQKGSLCQVPTVTYIIWISI